MSDTVKSWIEERRAALAHVLKHPHPDPAAEWAQSALDALSKVLELHSPATVYTWAEDCADPENHHLFTDVRSGGMLCEDEPIGRFCNGCVPENDTTIDVDEYPCPCPTVQAIGGEINE